MKVQTLIMIAAFFATTVLVALPARTQVTTVTVRVDGLSCPFCAYGLEKKIKSVPGTKEPVINVEEGVVTLTPTGDASIDFDGLREAVKKAGFTPREIGVEGIGRVATIDGRPTLVAEDGQRLFLLAQNDVLTSLQTDTEDIVVFSGTLAPRENDDDAPLRTLSLLSAVLRKTGDLD